MTINTTETVSQSEAQHLYEIAVSSCTDILSELDLLRDRYRAQEDVSETEVKRALHECLRIMNHVYDHRKKFDELRKREAGAATGYAIDFDRARDEIGRLLDRLRAAAGTGELPDQPD
ncbi:hypothetical protein [Palleronia caenipelagi]|uniref:hypothetical protein n=1 Tax=Palleronia caenipelagi TaxID=2489174 RepID=UPI001FE6C41F|nr:hypothetical protein [Palleronia caenipelagi]